MAVISRSIPAIPYQGGTLLTAQPYSAAVQLTPTRMVWTYCQQNPNWRFFVIVDTPEGWANGGTPAVTVSRMQDQKVYRGNSLQMARLNDNAFIVMDFMSDRLGSSSSNGNPWSYEVFEINSENVFTRTATNLDGYDVLIDNTSVNIPRTVGIMYSQQVAAGKYNNPATLIPSSVDNNLMMAGWTTGSQIAAVTMAYNPTTKAMTFSNSNVLAAAWPSSGPSASVSGEVFWNTIPGSTKKAIGFRATSVINAWTSTSMAHGMFVVNADNSYAGNYGNMSGALGTNAATVVQPLDIVMMSDLRLARTSWNWIYYYGLTGGSATASGTSVNDGFGSYASTTSTNAQIALPMDANYLMLMDRTHFATSTSGALKVKIVRREDANMTAQSPGSAIAATGFDVTAPWIDTWRNDSRPRMLPNGDVFWWGLDSTGALAWNVMKNAS